MIGTVAQAKQLHANYGTDDESNKNYIEIIQLYERKLKEEPKGVAHLL